MLNIGDFARLGQVSPRMLRHYDELGLLTPERVDPQSGYRLYRVHQLERLHRIVALRDMGFGLEQIRQILSEGLGLEELKGMLRLRRAQIEHTVGEEQERLRRVEAHLRALEWRDTMQLQDVVIKQTQPIRVAQASADGLTHADIGGAWSRLIPLVRAHLVAHGVTPGIEVGVYEDEGGSVPEGEIVLHAGIDIGEQELPEDESVRVVELPVEEAATAIYSGGVEGISAAWETLVQWIDDSGYRLVGNCRELYHVWAEGDPANDVVELQQPVAR
jgi:DNA-binding transcriptional MerR regulator/effector-binding domain-containing protein